MGVEPREAGRWIHDRRTDGNTTDHTVPEEARRAGEIWGRWSWVELSVWTERMLTALENGVKGGKWYTA
jgi:hypothetical protein